MAGQLTIDTLKASSGVLATQNGMTGIAKAWVNFAGASGTINGSFNVSSVTRYATGDYTITYSTALSNANYAVSGCVLYSTSAADSGVVLGIKSNSGSVILTTSVRIQTSFNSVLYDANTCMAQIVGT